MRLEIRIENAIVLQKRKITMLTKGKSDDSA